MLIDQGTNVDMRGTEIIFRTGTIVVGGGKLHAYLGYTGYCTNDMSGRNEFTDTNSNAVNNNHFSVNKEQHTNQITDTEIAINIFPNPASKDGSITIELFNEKSATAEIYDLTGRLLQSNQIFEGLNQMRLFENASSILIVKIKTNEGKISYKKLALY